MTWQNDPNKFAVEMLKDADALTKRITVKVLQEVIAKSPIDTGAFRGNHRVGIGSIDTTANKADTGNPLQKGIATIQAGGGIGKLVYISNSLPYAVRLENGHSPQAPSGIYSIAFLNAVNSV